MFMRPSDQMGLSWRPKYGLKPPTKKCPVHDSKSAGEMVLQQEDKEKREEEGGGVGSETQEGCPGCMQPWKIPALVFPQELLVEE